MTTLVVIGIGDVFRFFTLPVAVPVQATALRGHRRAYRALFLSSFLHHSTPRSAAPLAE